MSLLKAYEELTDIYDLINSTRERVENATKDDLRAKAQAAHEEAMKRWESYNSLPDVDPMTLLERLEQEQKYTSVYFSGDPLDSFEVDVDKYTAIDKLEDGKTVTIAAALSDRNDLKTRKDAQPMMSGKLSDRTGTVDMIIFPKAFAKIGDQVETVMGWKGKLSGNGDEDPQFIVEDVVVLPKKSKRMIVWFDDYNTTKALIAAGNVPKEKRFDCMETFMVGKNSPVYRTGKYISEEYAKANGLKYTIE